MGMKPGRREARISDVELGRGSGIERAEITTVQISMVRIVTLLRATSDPALTFE